jgi:hypothetical protein
MMPIEGSGEWAKTLSDKELVDALNARSGADVSETTQEDMEQFLQEFGILKYEAYARKDRARSKLMGFAAFAFIPPLMLLVLGGALNWALQGFRA